MHDRKHVRIIRLGQLKSQKFARMAHTQQPHLTYNNGPLLANVEVFTVFWGATSSDVRENSATRGALRNRR